MAPELSRDLLERRAPRRAPLSRRLADLGAQWFVARTSRVVPGERRGTPVDLAPLICPLRYDVEIRAALMAAFADGSAPRHPTPADAARIPALAHYLAWVRRIALPVGQPQYLDDDEAIFGAFVRRYHRARRLWASVSRDGIHPDTRIRLLTGRRVQLPPGKQLGTDLFAGDGCHRIACLMVLGRTRLQPHEYEVEERLWLRPHDNTARLLGTDALPRATWLQFLAGRYAPGEVPGDAAALRAAAARLRPDLLAELDSILSTDLPRALP